MKTKHYGQALEIALFNSKMGHLYLVTSKKKGRSESLVITQRI